MMPARFWLLGPRIASAFLLLALLLVTRSAWRAIELEPAPAAVSADNVRSFAGFPQPPGRGLKQALAAVERDPFHPERRRPTERFRLPADAVATVAVEQPVRLLGTVMLPDGAGFALCQWAGEPPRRVGVGERVSDLTLIRVEPGRAVFRSESRGEVVVQRSRTGS